MSSSGGFELNDALALYPWSCYWNVCHLVGPSGIWKRHKFSYIFLMLFHVIVKNGHALDIAPFNERISLQKCSSMALVVEGFYSVTYTPTCLSTNGMNHTCLCLPSQSWSSFTDPRGMEGWVGLGTTMVSKQSVQDFYVMVIAVVSCLNRHTTLGSWSRRAMGVELTSSRAVSREANHWVTHVYVPAAV